MSKHLSFIFTPFSYISKKVNKCKNDLWVQVSLEFKDEGMNRKSDRTAVLKEAMQKIIMLKSFRVHVLHKCLF